MKIGLSPDTMHETYRNYTFSFGLVALIFDFFFFTFLGLYLEKVLPKEFGETYPAGFLFSPSYWGCSKKPANN